MRYTLPAFTPSLLLATLTILVYFSSLIHAVPSPRDQTTTGKTPSKRSLEARGILDSIKNFLGLSAIKGYGPFQVTSPAYPVAVRQGGDLGQEEAAWVNGRMKVANVALTEYLGRVGMKDFDHQAFMRNYTPTVGMAFSGGGFRAMLSGAGMISGFDARTPRAMGPGGLGGLLQGTTYLAGLSGGGWLVGSMAVNNFPSVGQIQKSERLWKLKHSILNPFGKGLNYIPGILTEVKEKSDAGFDITLTDIWSLMLSRVFIDQPDGGPKMTLSNIADLSAFRNFQMPFPMWIAVGRSNGSKDIPRNATVFEVNPLEFGSHDPAINAFSQTKMLGSDYSEGKPEIGGKFINGFDNAAFVMGTSSSIFNQILIDLKRNNANVLGGGIIQDLVMSALEFLSKIEVDIADWAPNPFYNMKLGTDVSATATKDLTLVDGSMDLENIPLNPLLCPHRGVDVIIAADNSADTVRSSDGTPSNWPNGTSLIATYERFVNKFMSEGASFPEIPDVHTFVNKGFNSRPTFFGCDAKKFTGSPSPLLVYIPNAPYNVFSNVSTFKLSYEDEQRDMMIDNGYMAATQGNGVIDPEWPACVGCALIHREVERKGMPVTEQCQQCLKRYCWDGSRDTNMLQDYEPDLKLKPGMLAPFKNTTVVMTEMSSNNRTFTFPKPQRKPSWKSITKSTMKSTWGAKLETKPAPEVVPEIAPVRMYASPHIEDSTDYSRYRDYAG
ncbi:Lysophospholipase 1 [Orbilia ellipsospora]|uniref:Lysophospholipase n=1 Tax=Orbilia ellipsospora TaxID=2528407 RepID=A0AAV9X8V7_9PEZI